MNQPILTVIALLVSVVSSSQKFEIPKTIPSGTYKIIVKNDLSKDENFRFTGQTLIDNDYQIFKSDQTFHTISSEPKPHSKLSLSYKLNIIAKEGEIVITGQYITNYSVSINTVIIEPSWTTIKNKGQNGSVTKETFREMLKYAASLSDISNLQYETD